jgi:hypothetical protein
MREKVWIPVRLCDVPLRVRLDAAHELCRAEENLTERRTILAAALQPSSKTYFIPA